MKVDFSTLHPISIDNAWRAGQITVEDYTKYCNDVQEGHYDKEPPRFIEEGNSVIFPGNKARHHISFINTYKGLTIPQARRKMKTLWAGRSMQNEMIHYLKSKHLLKL